MIAGHTKFYVNQLFSQIAQSFNKSDGFSTAELGKVIIDQGDIVIEWHNCLTKYTTMPGSVAIMTLCWLVDPVPEMPRFVSVNSGIINEGCC